MNWQTAVSGVRNNNNTQIKENKQQKEKPIIQDYFSDFDDKVFENVNTNKMIKCIKSYYYSSIYGSYSIQSNSQDKFTWILQISRENNNVNNGKLNGIYIGISSTYICDSDCFSNTESSNYSCSLDGNKWSQGNQNKYHSEKFIVGDIMTMTLDCKNKQLSFSHNGKDLGIAYDNIDIDTNIKYKLAIIASQRGDQIQIINFIKGPNGDEDQVECI